MMIKYFLRISLASLLCFSFSFSLAQNISYDWAFEAGNGNGGDDEINGVVSDSLGNVYITGQFLGTVDFDPSASDAKLVSSVSTRSIFIAKYDSSGNYIWAKSIPGGVASSIAMDLSGDIYITGYFNGTSDFDPSSGSAYLTSQGRDVYIAKFDAAGNYIWAKGIGGTGSEWGYDLTFDKSNDLVVTGYFQDTVDFDPSGGVANLGSAGGEDVFVAKYDASGTYVWAGKIGGTSSDVGHQVTVDDQENIYITGDFVGTADFDPSGATANLTSNGSKDIFVSKLDKWGNYIWAGHMGGADIDEGVAITLDKNKNIIISGSFSGVADFDPSAGTANLTSAGMSDVYLAKYDSLGNYQWSGAAGASGHEHGHAVVTDANNDIYVTGHYQSMVDFDFSGSTNTITSAGGEDVFMAKYDGTSALIWVKGFGSNVQDSGNDIVLDDYGNIMNCGYFRDTADFDPSSSVANQVSLVQRSFYVGKYRSSTGSYVHSFSSEDEIGGNDVGEQVAVDSAGYVYVAGRFHGKVDFDPSAGNAILNANGSSDVFLAKYDSLGNYLWAINIGGNAAEEIRSLVVDSAGNLVLAGFFNGTADFDPSASSANLTSAGGQDIFLAKYDNAGNYIWARAMGGTSVVLNAESATDIAINSNNEIILTGYFYGTADFDPSGATANLTSSGGFDIFLALYDASGSYQWAKRMGGGNFDEGKAVEVDMNGEIWLTGHFTGTADMDPSGATANLSSGGGYDAFLAKYTSAGNYITAFRIGGANNDQGTDLITAKNNDVIITGQFDGSVDFDPSGALYYLFGSGSGDIFFARYDASAAFKWAKQIGSSGNDKAHALSVNKNGHIYLSGYYEGTVDFNPGGPVDNLSSVSGSRDVFFAKYDSLGTYFWAESAGGFSGEESSSISVDETDDIYITGFFNDTADFDPKPSVSHLISKGQKDAFLAKYQPCSPVYGSISPTVCGSYTVPSGDETYSTSGTYQDTLSAANLCDSVIIINLTVDTVTYDTVNPSACNSYTVPSGDETYTASGSYSDTLSAMNGCDSIITINLTIYGNTSSSINVTTCDAYTVPSGDETYTVSGVYNDTIPNVNGCDSLISINLGILQSTSSTISDTACDAYTVPSGNATYSTSGTYSDTLTNSKGCDSLITINLTVNNTVNNSISVSTCDSYTVPSGDETYTVSGSYFDTIPASTGCDSILTIELTVVVPDTSVNRNNNTLTANANGAGYQWINCATGDTIGGAVSQTFEPASNGSYAVVVTQNGCTDTSNCHLITNVGWYETDSRAGMNIFPNPTEGRFVIDLGGTYSDVLISIRDIRGKQVYFSGKQSAGRVSVNLSGAAPGMYLVKVLTGDKVNYFRLVRD